MSLTELAADVRERHATAVQKLDALRLVVDERRHQLRQLVADDARPKTAFLQTPAYIRALYDAVRRTAIELRALLDAHDVTSGGSFWSSSCRREWAQLASLVADLERDLEDVATRLELHYRRRSPKPETEIDNTSQQLLPPLSDATAVVRPVRNSDRTKTRAVLLRMAVLQRNSETNREFLSYPKSSSFPQLPSPPPRRRLPPLDRYRVNASLGANKTVTSRQNLSRSNHN